MLNIVMLNVVVLSVMAPSRVAFRRNVIGLKVVAPH